MPKILLQSTSGHHILGSEFNKGAAAVVISTIETLRSFMPDAEFVTPIQFSDSFASQRGIKVVKNKLFSSKNFSLFESLKSSLLLLQCALWALLLKYLHLNMKSLINGRELKERAQADIIVDISMDHFSDDFGTLSIVEHSKDILFSVLLGKPVVMYAQSIGPLKNRLTSWLARFALNKVSLITVREEISRGYLREAGVNKPPIHVTADPSFLLQPAPESRTQEIFSEEGINKGARPLIGICVSGGELGGQSKQWSGYKKLVRLAYYILRYCLPEGLFKRLMKLARQTGYYSALKSEASGPIKLIREISDYLTKELDATVLLISHVVFPNRQDRVERGDSRIMAEAIHQQVLNKDKVKPIIGEYTAEETKGIIGQCDLFIGMKMHANIAALSQGVPTIGLSYSYKFRGIMGMLGQEECICDCATVTAEEVISKIDSVWEKRKKIRKELESKLTGVKELALANGELVKEIIDSG